ncbi:MAG: sulfatase-like hydrolase/transferase [Planctomycetes bacterium]|nr:sulfatase-like hydrolase/transferase [Planctomycetota bacterium]
MTEDSNTKKPLSKLYIWLLLIAVVVGAWFILKPVLCKKEIRNVVLISIDTCRADHLSCYGYSHKTTANIDAVAAQGVLFNHAVAPVALTLPSHSSMLTGTIPPYHKVRNNNDYRLDDSYVTLAEILKENGFATSAVIGSFVLDSRFGLDQGFDEYDDNLKIETEKKTAHYDERDAEQITVLANSWLERHHDQKFFLFLHYFDPHSIYKPHEFSFGSSLKNLYAGEIAYVDHHIGRVIEKLKDLNLYDSTLLVITSDHGEGLYDHFEETHGFFIYHSTVRVPLIVKVPGGAKGKKVDGVVGLVDIVPTVCGLLGIVPPSPMHGKNLSSVLKGKEELQKSERYIYCESFYSTQYGCNPLLGVVDDRWKYIQAPRQELYDLAEDVGEKGNLIYKYPKRALLMQENLKLILQEQACTDLAVNKFTLDEQSKRRLESLGYLAGAIDEDIRFDDSKDDPKDWIRLHQQAVLAKGRIATKRYSKAETVVRQMIIEKPEYILSYFFLGQIDFGKGNIDESIKHFSKFLSQANDTKERVPEDESVHRLSQYIYMAHSYLGDALVKQGKIDLAITNYEKALDLARATNQQLLVDEIKKQLELYKAGSSIDK